MDRVTQLNEEWLSFSRDGSSDLQRQATNLLAIFIRKASTYGIETAMEMAKGVYDYKCPLPPYGIKAWWLVWRFVKSHEPAIQTADLNLWLIHLPLPVPTSPHISLEPSPANHIFPS
ncbi:MAG: hypothetical protein HY459_03715 [Parcubacteria group bacterium]|nr:hypothetical protein [Parcubacteria group bacterium]